MGFEKCHLFLKEMGYLGHAVLLASVTKEHENLEALMSWPVPADKHQLRSLLWLHAYYRMFIDGLVHIVQPLMRQTEEKQTFECSSEIETAFRSLKEVLRTTPVLATRKQESSGPSVRVVALRETRVAWRNLKKRHTWKEGKSRSFLVGTRRPIISIEDLESPSNTQIKNCVRLMSSLMQSA